MLHVLHKIPKENGEIALSVSLKRKKTTVNKKPNDIGYLAHDGTIYLGKAGCYHTTRDWKYIYTVQFDLGSWIDWDTALKLTDEANSKKLNGHNDWSLPGGHNSTNEVRLFVNAFRHHNEIFKFNADSIYGTCTPYTNTRFYEMWLAKDQVTTTNKNNFSCFRLVRSSPKIIT